MGRKGQVGFSVFRAHAQSNVGERAMPIVSIYNNKGGEGKSTVTVGLAEFLAGNRGHKVLVIDLDAQASSSRALLGHDKAKAAIDAERSMAELFDRLRKCRTQPRYIPHYLICRDGTEAHGSALAELHVMVPDGDKHSISRMQLIHGETGTSCGSGCVPLSTTSTSCL